MRLTVATLLLLASFAQGASAQSRCNDIAALTRFDAEWERAYFELDLTWFDQHLAEDFVWVHNHVSSVDTRASMLRLTALERPRVPRGSRVQTQVETRIHGSTGLVTGYTTVDRGRGEPPVRYNFMRTYVLSGDQCLLLGNHTMVIPEGEGRGSGRAL